MSTHHSPPRRRAWFNRAIAVLFTVALTLGLGAGVVQAAPASSITPNEITAMARSIYADATDAMRYSFAVAAAEPNRAWPAGSIEAKLAAGFRDMPAQRRQAYANGAKSALAKPDSNFGRYGKTRPADYAGFARAYAESPLPVDAQRFGSALKAGYQDAMARRAVAGGGGASDAVCRDCPDPTPDCELTGECDPTPPPVRPKTGVKFMINRVTCIDETGSGVGEWGSDEIAFGGFVVTPAGETIQKTAYEIPQGFDDGTIWTFYNQGHVFGNFDLPLTYPAVYTATVLLTEVDAGGFANILNTVWQQVRGVVQQKIAEKVGQVLEPILRSQLIAQALGALAGYFAGELITWIVNSFQDDTFLQAGTSTITLNSIDDALPGGVFRFQDHDGTYDVSFSWSWRR
ncbi:hypothetical protein [Asanoa iriomotensis]|uniref:Uncharacterized protein n=1 Tax=Asanoa iriomotensis TaxID=234613 RepID=A0ABQ4C1U2_9ACTN|nr:hypothetical protein [Asanoa iriomotensis]GIF56709.1 hypothetical protein Air01nite_28040 [Asanoa iriomotensis]